MVTGYSRFLLDIMAWWGQVMKRSSYGEEVDYDPAQVERVRDELERHAAVMLPSHKSNLDGMIVPIVMHENGLPPVHTFAGINMAFWPLGTVLRRAGRIFIRRDMKDAVVYRWVLRQYLGYLVEKRFTLEWYIEGTRSRSGKLGPAFTHGVDDVAQQPHLRRTELARPRPRALDVPLEREPLLHEVAEVLAQHPPVHDGVLHVAADEDAAGAPKDGAERPERHVDAGEGVHRREAVLVHHDGDDHPVEVGLVRREHHRRVTFELVSYALD